MTTLSASGGPHTGEAALIASPGNGHPSIEDFRDAHCDVYSPDMTEGELSAQANGQLDGMMALVKSGVDQLRWHLSDSAQVFLPAGSTYDAYVEIRRVVESAT